MNTVLQRIGVLFLAVAVAVLFSSCEEALTGVDNSDGVPSIRGNNTPFVSIQTGNDGDKFTDLRSIPGLIPPQALTVQPNVAVDDTIVVDYEVTGPAEEGQDYTVLSDNPIRIQFDTSTTALESEDIVVFRGAPGGGSLTTQPTSAEVTLTGVSTTDGTEVLLGRGGEGIDITRAVGINPSVALVEDAPAIDTTEVGGSGFGTAVTQNVSTGAFTVQNVSISGPNADEFSLFGIAPNADSAEAGAFESPPVDVNPVANAFIAAVFQPESEGEKEATLSYELSNSVDTETFEVSLSAVAESGGAATSQSATTKRVPPTISSELMSKIEDKAALRNER